MVKIIPVVAGDYTLLAIASNVTAVRLQVERRSVADTRLRQVYSFDGLLTLQDKI